MNIPELLAPAGSVEALRAAFSAGADAVYIGGDRYGARAYAENPDQESLLSAIDLTHRLGRKIYLTVNTLCKEPELTELTTWLLPYYESGIDAVIVQDLGVLQLLREEMPDLPVHASTQMAVTGAHGASFLQELGASRVIAARELSLNEIRSIIDGTGMDVEVFVHGAMCYSVSGLCLMSSMIGGRSGNRGRCAGICRLPFECSLKGKTGEGEDFPLNMKDMCAIDLLPDLVEAGVCSLKIEGRMKRPEYTAGVTAVYRNALDRIASGNTTRYTTEEEKARLHALFNRDGFTQGYFFQRNGADMVAIANEKLQGGRAQAASDAIDEVRQTLRQQEKDHALQRAVIGELQMTSEEGIHLTVTMPAMTQTEETYTVHVYGGAAETAKAHALDADTIKKQLDKTGESPFWFSRLTMHIDDGLFAPMHVFRDIRRAAFAMLDQKINDAHHRIWIPADIAGVLRHEEAPRGTRQAHAPVRPKTEEEIRIHVEVTSPAQLETVLKTPSVSRVYLPYALREQIAQVREHEKEAWIALPMMLSGSEIALLEEAFRDPLYAPDGLLLRNLEEAAWFLRNKDKGTVRTLTDLHLYTLNERAAGLLASLGLGDRTLPVELTQSELQAQDTRGSEMIVYGRTPMMVTRQCLKKTYGQCDGKASWVTLTDRKRMRFPVYCDCTPCGNVIYNSVPTDLIAQGEAIRRLAPSSIRLVFTTEDTATTGEILRRAKDLVQGNDREMESMPGTTRGHFHRGVE